jgi:hypothetical protein
MLSEYEGEYYDRSLDNYNTYEEYLDDFIDEKDMKYLGDIELARQLIELGIHNKTQILKKDQFEAKKKAIEEARKNQNNDKAKELTHTLVDPSFRQDKFLDALANLEDDVRRA